MKSIKIDMQPFSLEDFEEGLMLAGLITPSTVEELYARQQLEEFEATQNKKNSSTDNVFFKRVVLSAKIVSELHKEPTFGHVKFQKMIYLCEQAASIILTERYLKQAAGPFDNKFMHTIDAELKRLKWFNVEKSIEGKYKKFKYSSLEKAEDYKRYYDSYFGNEAEEIDWLINTFRKSYTNDVELVATIHACYTEIRNKQEIFSETLLVTRFFEWSKEKQKFTKEQVLNSFDWMKENGVVTP